ncbi:uncharacterized protein LOC106869331 [Octopus bimaculoides]|uniref:uncharacterized protein LOC106869331 n=1 Tax=Octopus bimaculoides TaxID=37653 RepID=UPI00071E227A|nr:uncharacterized protein LOC106869331 [Octopus bimaculoides]|eukprot:XP_014770527.1 PREDICTED: uncharacterized protein LOC106869331 [Octopus bimaculoides]
MNRNTIITPHKGGESKTAIAKKLKINQTVWKIDKKFQETGSTTERPGRSRKRSERTPQFIKNTREKMWRNTRHSVRRLAATAKIRRTSMYRVLKEDLRTHPYKIICRHELTQVYKAMKLERSRFILRQISEGTLPNLVFTNERKLDIEQTVNHQNDRLWSVSGFIEGRFVN